MHAKRTGIFSDMVSYEGPDLKLDSIGQQGSLRKFLIHN